MDYMAYAIAIEELSRGCASTGVGGDDWVDGRGLFVWWRVGADVDAAFRNQFYVRCTYTLK